MFWAEKLSEQIKKRFEDRIKSGDDLIIRDEWTASGRPTTGSLRGIVIHGVVSDFLTDRKIKNRYLFEINDFDPMDGIPNVLDEKEYRQYMGRVLGDIPAPDSSADNLAEYFAKEFIEVVERTGYTPEFYRSSEVYKAGKYNDVIRMALDKAEIIRAIYREVSGSEKADDWLPIQIVCESCGKIGTTKATAWDGEKVTYECSSDYVEWADGCGHSGSVAPFDGRAKLPWKVEWPAKFIVLKVDVEGAGKDHSTKGGSRDIARRMLKEVFNDAHEPVNIPYEFITIDGKKMSSSKGTGLTAKDLTDHLPRKILRLLQMKEPRQPIEFNPYGDTIPVLYDRYDAIANDFFSGEETEWASVYPFFFIPKERGALTPSFMPRFSILAYLVQMPHINLEEKVTEMKGELLTEADLKELRERVEIAQHWLEHYSPEKFKFTVQETVPVAASSFSDVQKKALAAIVAFMNAHKNATGEELHTHIHDIKKEQGIPPKDLFSAIYLSILGKDSGPQAGWFLTALNRDFVINRLTEVSS